jgi:hypothetical protein
VQEWACAAHFNFAANNADNKVKIAEAGAIEAVLAAMAVHEGSAFRHGLVYAEQPRSAS